MMRKIHFSLYLLVMLILSIQISVVHALQYKEINGVRVIENQTFTSNVTLQGAEWNGAIIRNNIFKNTLPGVIALYIKDARDVLIENNEFFDLQYFAILLTALKVQKWGTDNITIKGNYFHDTASTVIHTKEPNKNVKIIDNTFKNVAMVSHKGKPNHAIYLKGPDFLVEGNRIDGVGDAVGISARSSGIIRGNLVMNTGRFGIGYYSNSKAKGNGILIIENNVVVNCNKAGIYLKERSGYPKIDKGIVRFNTLVNNNKASYSKEIWISIASGINLQIYGNIVIDSKKAYFRNKHKIPISINMANLYSPSDIGFVDFAGQGYRLKQDSSARNFVSRIPGAPPYDFLKNSMGKEPFNAGAYQ